MNKLNCWGYVIKRPHACLMVWIKGYITANAKKALLEMEQLVREGETKVLHLTESEASHARMTSVIYCLKNKQQCFIVFENTRHTS